MKRRAHSCVRRLCALRKDDFKEMPPDPIPPSPGILKLSLLIPLLEPTVALESALREAYAFLSDRFRDDFEIILVPNPPAARSDAAIGACAALAAGYARAKVVPHLASPGKGAALRTGFLASAGNVVLFTDADLPYDLGFIDAALVKLDQGFDLVIANRRLDDARPGFRPPAYDVERRRLGLLFNRAVRLLFPIRTADTQAGLKAMSRRLASAAFSRARCPGFFFDLEIFLSCLGKGWTYAEVPVTQRRDDGESTVCVPRESLLAVYWLFRLWAGYARGRYGSLSGPNRGLSAVETSARAPA